MAAPLVNSVGNSSVRVSGLGSEARDTMSPHGPGEVTGLAPAPGVASGTAACCGDPAAVGVEWVENQRYPPAPTTTSTASTETIMVTPGRP